MMWLKYASARTQLSLTSIAITLTLLGICAAAILPNVAYADLQTGEIDTAPTQVNVGFGASSGQVSAPSLTITRAYSGKLTLKKGSSYKLGAKATGKAKITYKSSAPRVVKVSKKGKLKARKIGKAAITVKAKVGNQTKTKKVKVKVVKPSRFKKVKKVKATVDRQTITVGQKTEVKASVSPKKSSNKNIVFKTSNASIAEVTAAGEVIAKKEGKVTITAVSASNGKAKSSVSVEVVNPLQLDSDGDGFSDYVEQAYMGTNPNKYDSAANSLPEKVVFADGVVQASPSIQVMNVDQNGDHATLLLSALPEGLEIGSILAVPSSERCPGSIAIKVSNINRTGAGRYEVSGNVAELGDVVDYACVDEGFSFDVGAIELAEGCEIESITQGATRNVGALRTQDLDTDFQKTEVTISVGKAGKEKGKLSGSVKLTLDGGHAKVVSSATWWQKMDTALWAATSGAALATGNSLPMSSRPLIGAMKLAQNIDYMDVAVYGSITPSIKYKGEISNGDGREIDLGRIPIIGAAWTGGYLDLRLIVKIDGSISLKVAIDYDYGAVYDKNAATDKFKVAGDGFSFGEPTIGLEVSAKIGFNLKPTAKLLGQDVLSIAGEMGVKAIGKTDTTYGCLDIGAGKYGEVSAELLGFLRKLPNIKLKATYQFLNPDKAPIWGPYHVEDDWTKIENWVKNGKCTKKGSEAWADFPKSFWFASGVGGWSTTLDVASDGTFTGYYHDSEGGMRFETHFTGEFTTPVKIGEYAYSMQLKRLVITDSPEDEIVNGVYVVHVTDEVYGLGQVTDVPTGSFTLYLPGQPRNVFSESAASWLDVNNASARPIDYFAIVNSSSPNYDMAFKSSDERSEESLMKDHVENRSENAILYWFYEDFDGDGTKEGMAITGIPSQNYEGEWTDGELWFASDGAVEWVNSQEYGLGNALNGLVRDEENGRLFLSIENDGHGSGSSSSVYAVHHGGWSYAIFDLGTIGNFHNVDGKMVGYTQVWDNGCHQYAWHEFEYRPDMVAFISTGLLELTDSR